MPDALLLNCMSPCSAEIVQAGTGNLLTQKYRYRKFDCIASVEVVDDNLPNNLVLISDQVKQKNDVTELCIVLKPDDIVDLS